MTIDASTAVALDALALAIFDPQITPSSSPALGDHWGPGVGLTAQDDATDAKLAALIAPVMLAIDGRTLATGFKFTLNITNATQLRPKHWFMQYDEHDGSTYGWPASILLQLHMTTGAQPGQGVLSWGGSLGLATCAAICKAWAQIVRLWLAGTYPLAVTQPAQFVPPGWVAAQLKVGGYLAQAQTIFKISAQSGVMWQATFFADASGNFPVTDTYETTRADRWFNMEDGIIGVAPGDQMTALSAGGYALREGLVYFLVSEQPDKIAPGTIWGCRFVKDTTGTYALANDPAVLAEVQFFGGTDLTPCDSAGRTA